MKIKDRLSVYFTLYCAAILLLFLGAVFFAFSYFLQDDFYKRLKDRTMVTGRLYLEADEISNDSLNRVRERYIERIPGEIIHIYDQKNRSLFIPGQQQNWPKNIINRVRKEGYIQYRDKERQVVGIYYKDNQGDFAILASAVDVGSKTRMGRLLQIMAVTFVFITLLIFISGRWLAQRTLSPIDGLVNRIKLIRADNLHLRVDEGRPDEIGILAKNFNNLLQHLQNAFEIQQTFVANASHELRTPITSIMGNAEVGLKHPRSAQEYEDILRIIVEDASVLSDTISNLMELARADMAMSRATLAPVRLDDLLWEMQEYWNKKGFTGCLDIIMDELPENPDKLTMPANRALLLLALNNIVSNGIKFSGNRCVTARLSTGINQLIIKFTDNGIGITEADNEHIFSPFFRAEKASGFPGNGIGLYVTQKIIALYGGHIDAVSTPGKGSVFTVVFQI